MLIRRRQLWSAASAAASTKLVRAQHQGVQEAPASLPPAIAALKTRRAEAKPITVAERKDRLERDEPGIYIPGEFGVRLEDDMHITTNRAELLTPQSPSPDQPFARS